jgi:hypothetical protein
LKVRLTEQFAPASTVAQVEPATANSDGLLLLTLDTETAVPPVLATVTLLAALVVVLILVVLAAGLTALGYGPLASRFKSLRSSESPAVPSILGGSA